MERLRVHRDRVGQYQPSVLPRYQCRQDQVNSLVQEVVEPVLGPEISPQAVSRTARSLDGAVEHYHQRPQQDCYRYLLLDGITLKVKGATEVKKRLVLCAYGIRLESQRDLLSFRSASPENEVQWEAFLRYLHQLGLHGQSLGSSSPTAAPACTEPWTQCTSTCRANGAGLKCYAM